MSLLNCNTSSLTPYVPSSNMPWNVKRVQHLFRRLGFGANPVKISQALSLQPNVLIDQLLNEAINLPTSPAPLWANWTISRYADPNEYIAQNIEWTVQWSKEMLTYGLREKIALFWHNHFVTELDKYRCPSWQYEYHKILQGYAFGNFKDFVKAMGKTPAMLVYLNGVQNTRFEPNENYARELYELFTLGRDNGYTQQDIKETARALTGWNGFTELCAPITFVNAFFDNGQKNIFGRSGSWNYDTLHDILFEERANQIATFICTKIYRAFVSPTVDETIVAELATTFKANNFELAPVFRQLFKSEHFFDDNIIGVVIKSPLELFLNIVTEWGFRTLGDEALQTLLYFSGILGQGLFNPVDVAGWQGDRTWVDSNTLSTRWSYGGALVYNTYLNEPSVLVNLARILTNNSNNPYFITETIINYMMPNGFQNETAYERATAVFKSEVPENYYQDGSWSLDWDSAPAQVAILLNYLMQQPEFQLM